jgi:hypothetical protein
LHEPLPATLLAAIEGHVFSRMAHPERNDGRAALGIREAMMGTVVRPRAIEAGA